MTEMNIYFRRYKLKEHRLKEQTKDIDVLLPVFFKKRAGSVHFFEKISTTMEKAKELAQAGSPDFTIVIAEEQFKGRGRLNRKWSSAKGGLWFTVILRPDLSPELAFQVNFAASLSMSNILKTKYGLNVSVKWPNDILLNDKKLAGLLSEMETKGDTLSFVNIGIGINVNNTPEAEEPNAVSIKNVLGKNICRRELLSQFLDDFENLLIDAKSNFQNIIDKWKTMTSTIGKDVCIKTFGETYEGVAADIDMSGALIIKQKDGSEKRVIYGDCFYSQINKS